MKYLTTGQAAKYACVSSQTMSRWVDRKILKGHKIPGVKNEHRRVDPVDLVRLIKMCGIPLHPDLYQYDTPKEKTDGAAQEMSSTETETSEGTG